MMEKAKGLTSSRRDFLKASGLALLGSAAAAGAFGAVPKASAYAEGDAAAAAPAEAGIANFETDMYSDVFPTGVATSRLSTRRRTWIVRARWPLSCAKSARTRLCVQRRPTCSWPAAASPVCAPHCPRLTTVRPRCSASRR